jgi:hypothetical protein
MGDVLWFLRGEDGSIEIFEDRRSAIEQMEAYAEDGDGTIYRIKKILIDELEDHPAEYDIALEAGFI